MGQFVFFVGQVKFGFCWVFCFITIHENLGILWNGVIFLFVFSMILLYYLIVIMLYILRLVDLLLFSAFVLNVVFLVTDVFHKFIEGRQ